LQKVKVFVSFQIIFVIGGEISANVTVKSAFFAVNPRLSLIRYAVK